MDEQKPDKKIVYYLGLDNLYWSKLQQQLKDAFSEVELEFVQSEVGKDFNYADEFLKIFENRYKVIYLDYSLNFEHCLRVAELLNNEPQTREVAIAGLHEYLNYRAQIARSFFAGVQLNYIKGGEIYDAAFQPIHKVYSIDNDEKPFTTIKIETVQNVIQPLKAWYTTSDHYYVETNNPFPVGGEIKIAQHPLKDLHPAKEFIVAAQREENLFRRAHYGHKFQFTYVNSKRFVQDYLEMVKSQEIVQEQVQRAYEEECRRIYQKIDEHLKEQPDSSHLSFTRIIVVDPEYRVFREEAFSLEDLSYYALFMSEIKGYYETVSRLCPQMMAFQLTEENRDSIIQYFSFIKQNKQLGTPLVIVFGVGDEVDELKKTLNYNNLILHKTDISWKIVNGVALKTKESFESKRLNFLQSEVRKRPIQQHDNRTMGLHGIRDLAEKRVYYDLEDAQACLDIEVEITIVQINETEIVFKTNHMLVDGDVLILSRPVDFFATMIPFNKTSYYYQRPGFYRAFINGISEESKQNLRQYIISKEN